MQFESFQQPGGLLGGETRLFLFILFSRFFLAWLFTGREAVILFIIAGRAGRHVWRGNAATTLFELFAQLLLFHAHHSGHLLQLFNLVDKFRNAAVHDIGVIARVLVFAIEFHSALEITG